MPEVSKTSLHQQHVLHDTVVSQTPLVPVLMNQVRLLRRQSLIRQDMESHLEVTMIGRQA